MSALTMTVERDTATPMLKRLSAAFTTPGGKEAVGEGAVRLIGDHLRAKDQSTEPKQGWWSDGQSWPKQGFYAQAARSIAAPQVDGEGVTITVAKTGLRQRYFGGDIEPSDGKTYLTIPGSALAYGNRALEFTDDSLKFAFAYDRDGNLRPALVTTESLQMRGSTRNRKGMGPKPPVGPDSVAYWLVRHVHQEPDTTVLPAPEEFAIMVTEALRDYVEGELADGGVAS